MAHVKRCGGRGRIRRECRQRAESPAETDVDDEPRTTVDRKLIALPFEHFAIDPG